RHDIRERARAIAEELGLAVLDDDEIAEADAADRACGREHRTTPQVGAELLGVAVLVGALVDRALIDEDHAVMIGDAERELGLLDLAEIEIEALRGAASEIDLDDVL